MSDWGSACSSWCGWCGACTAGPRGDTPVPERELLPADAIAALEKFLREKQARIEAITRAQAREDERTPF